MSAPSTTTPETVPFQPLAYGEWESSPEAARIADPLERIQKYDDRTRRDLFRAGLYDAEAEAEISAAGADQALRAGLIASPEEYAPVAKDRDSNFYARQLIQAGDTEKAQAIYRYNSFLSRPDTDPNTLERARIEAEIDEPTKNELTRKAVRMGELPFAVVPDKDGNPIFELDPELGALDRTQILDLAGDDFDPRFLPDLERQFSRVPGTNLTPAQFRQAGVFDTFLKEQLKSDEFLFGELERSQQEYDRTGQLSAETQESLDRTLAGLDADNEFTPATRGRLIRDTIRRGSKPEAYDPENPGQHIQYLEDGTAWLPEQTIFDAAKHDALVDSLSITPEQKEAAKKLRAGRLESIAPAMVDAMGADPTALDFYEKSKAAGKTDSEIATEWYGKPENYSWWGNRARSFGMSLIEAGPGLIQSIGALAGNESAREALQARAGDTARNEEYARLFGDSYGVGQTLLNTSAQVAADLLVGIGVSAVATPVAGAAVIGSRAAASSLVRSLARTALTEGARSTAAGFLRSGVGSAARTLATMSDDVAVNLARSIGGQTGVAASSFTRSAGSAYVQAYSALDAQTNPAGQPLYSAEEKRKIALGTAMTAGTATAAITLGFGKILGGGVEDLVTGKIGTGVLKRIYGATDEQIVAATRTSAMAILSAAGAEAPEEAADQLVGNVIQALGTGEEFRLGPALKEALEAGLVGGLLGAGTKSIEVGIDKYRNAKVVALEKANAPASAAALEAKTKAAATTPAAKPTVINQDGLRIQENPPLSPDPFSYGDEPAVGITDTGGAVRVSAAEIEGQIDAVDVQIADLKIVPASETEGQKVRRTRKLQELNAEKTRLKAAVKNAKASGGFVLVNTTNTTAEQAAITAEAEVAALDEEIAALSAAPAKETKAAATKREASLEQVRVARAEAAAVAQTRRAAAPIPRGAEGQSDPRALDYGEGGAELTTQDNALGAPDFAPTPARQRGTGGAELTTQDNALGAPDFAPTPARQRGTGGAELTTQYNALASTEAVPDDIVGTDQAPEPPDVEVVPEAAPQPARGVNNAAPQLQGKGAKVAGMVEAILAGGASIDLVESREDATTRFGLPPSTRKTNTIATAYVRTDGTTGLLLYPGALKLSPAQLAKVLAHERIHLDQYAFESTPEGEAAAAEAESVFDKGSPNFDKALDSLMRNEYPSWDQLPARNKLRESTRAAVEGLMEGETSHFKKGLFSYIGQFLKHVQSIFEGDTAMTPYVKALVATYERNTPAAVSAAAPVPEAAAKPETTKATKFSRKARALVERLLTPESRSQPPEYLQQQKAFTPTQTAIQSRIAALYEALPVDDSANPEVVQAYQNLVTEVVAQYRAMLETGIKIEMGSENPYATSGDMINDVERGRLWIYKTEPGSYGSDAMLNAGNHPMLAPTEFTDLNGEPMLANDVFRAVHDYVAHAAFGFSFGPLGEEAAWKAHLSTLRDPLARLALTTETRGQNSWVNYRPEMVRDGMPLKKGDPGYIAPQDRPFATQKFALLPEEAMTLVPIVAPAKTKKPTDASLAAEMRAGNPLPIHETLFNDTISQGWVPTRNILLEQLSKAGYGGQKYGSAFQEAAIARIRALYPLVEAPKTAETKTLKSLGLGDIKGAGNKLVSIPVFPDGKTAPFTNDPVVTSWQKAAGLSVKIPEGVKVNPAIDPNPKTGFVDSAIDAKGVKIFGKGDSKRAGNVVGDYVAAQNKEPYGRSLETLPPVDTSVLAGRINFAGFEIVPGETTEDDILRYFLVPSNSGRPSLIEQAIESRAPKSFTADQKESVRAAAQLAFIRELREFTLDVNNLGSVNAEGFGHKDAKSYKSYLESRTANVWTQAGKGKDGVIDTSTHWNSRGRPTHLSFFVDTAVKAHAAGAKIRPDANVQLGSDDVDQATALERAAARNDSDGPDEIVAALDEAFDPETLRGIGKLAGREGDPVPTIASSVADLIAKIEGSPKLRSAINTALVSTHVSAPGSPARIRFAALIKTVPASEVLVLAGQTAFTRQQLSNISGLFKSLAPGLNTFPDKPKPKRPDVVVKMLAAPAPAAPAPPAARQRGTGGAELTPQDNALGAPDFAPAPATEPSPPMVYEGEALVPQDNTLAGQEWENTPVSQTVAAAAEESLTPGEKTAAAKELGFPTWTPEARTSFVARFTDWFASGGKLAVGALTPLFNKVRVIIAASTLAMTSMVSINDTPARDIRNLSPDKIAKEVISAKPKESPRAAEAQRLVDFDGVSASRNVRVMAQWVLDNEGSAGRPFVVADKVGGTIYLFTPDGALVKKGPALFGTTPGDIQAPQDKDLTIEQRRANRAAQVTEAGRFGAVLDSEGAAVVFNPGKNVVMAIHAPFLGRPAEKRMERLDSPDPEDNRVSLGCINVPADTVSEVVTQFQKSEKGGVVFVLPETEAGKQLFPGFSDLDVPKERPAAQPDAAARARMDSVAYLDQATIPTIREDNRAAIADLQLDGDLRSAIERIARSAKYPRRYRAAMLAALKMQVLPNISIVDAPTEAYAGSYIHSGRLITLNIASSNGRGMLDVLAHELLHAATLEAIANPQTKAAKDLLAKLERARQKAAEVIPDDMAYAVSSIDEFITHAATDPRLQVILRETFEKGKTTWQRVVDAIAKFFGIANSDFVSDLWGFINHAAEYGLRPGVAASREQRSMPGTDWARTDAEYLAAVAAGDMVTAQRMVDEAARAAGYTERVNHATPFEFTEFSRQFIAESDPDSEVRGFHLSNEADEFSAYVSPPRERDAARARRGRIEVLSLFVRPGRTIDRRSAERMVRAQLRENPESDAASFPAGYDTVVFRAASGTPTTEQRAAYARGEAVELANGYSVIESSFVGVDGQTYTSADLFRTDDPGQIITGFLDLDDAFEMNNESHIVVRDPEQIKSADPVTRDDAGNVIPLSARFRPSSPDIRYTIGSVHDALKTRETGAALPRGVKTLPGMSDNPESSTVEKQFENLDEIFATIPNPIASQGSWITFMRAIGKQLGKKTPVPIAPDRAVGYSAGRGFDHIMVDLKQHPEYVEARTQGLATGTRMLEDFRSGKLGRQDLASLFLWGLFSRGIGAYPQEGAFSAIHRAGLLDKLEQTFTGQMTPVELRDWALESAKGSPVGGAHRNVKAIDAMLNALTYKFDGRLAIDVLLDAWKSDMTGPQLRREVYRMFTKDRPSLQIQNKVLSFIILVSGRPDVLVLDRVQFRHLWGGEKLESIIENFKRSVAKAKAATLRRADVKSSAELQKAIADVVPERTDNVYDRLPVLTTPEAEAKAIEAHAEIKAFGSYWATVLEFVNPKPAGTFGFVKVSGKKKVARSGLVGLGNGLHGLAAYEAIERGLSAATEQAYRDAGIEYPGIGAFHWDSWLVSSRQAISHPTLELIAGSRDPGTSVMEGKFNTINYGMLYRYDGMYMRELLTNPGHYVMLTPEAAKSAYTTAAVNKALGRKGKNQLKLKKSEELEDDEDGPQERTRPWTEDLSPAERSAFDKWLRTLGPTVEPDPDALADGDPDGRGDAGLEDRPDEVVRAALTPEGAAPDGSRGSADQYLPTLPAGVSYEFDDSRPKYLAYARRSKPGVVTVNKAALAAAIEGLSPANARAIVSKVVKHEIAHLAAFSAFTDAEIAEMARGMSMSEIAAVARRYYNSPDALTRLAADLESGAITNEALVEEYLRMQLELASDGSTTEATIAFHSDNPGFVARLVKYLRDALVALWKNVAGPQEDYVNRVAISRLAREYRAILRGHKPLRAEPFDPANPGRDDRYVGTLGSAQTPFDPRVNWNAREGTGAVPLNQEVGYFGFTMPMTARNFRRLVPAGVSGPDTKAYILGRLAAGDPLAQPFLKVEFDEVAGTWRVRDHEGRSRVDAIIETYGPDTIIPVQFFPRGEMRARDISTEMRYAEVVPQGGGAPVAARTEDNAPRGALASQQPTDPDADAAIRETFTESLEDFTKPYEPGSLWRRLFVVRTGDRRFPAISDKRQTSLVANERLVFARRKQLEKTIKEEAPDAQVLAAAAGDTSPTTTPEQDTYIAEEFAAAMEEARGIKDPAEQATAIAEAYELKQRLTTAAYTETARIKKRRIDEAFAELERTAPKSAANLKAMREGIDNISRIVKEYQPEASPLRMVLDSQDGIYLTRVYKIHHKDGDPLSIFSDPAMADVRERAQDQLLESIIKYRTAEIIEQEAEAGKIIGETEARAVALKEAEEQDLGRILLEDYLLSHGSKALPHNGTDFRTDLTRFFKKMPVPEALRNVLEEVNDPVELLTRTGLNVGMLAASTVFTRDLARAGFTSGAMVTGQQWSSYRKLIQEPDNDKYLAMLVDNGWARRVTAPGYVEVAPDVHIPAWLVKAKEARDLTYVENFRKVSTTTKKADAGKLADLYAHPTVADWMDHVFAKQKAVSMDDAKLVQKIGEVFAKATGTSLGIATLGSVGFYTRNLVGVAFFLAANGINPFSAKSMRASRLAIEAFMNTESGEVTKLTGIGVLNDDLRPQTIKELLKGETDRPGELNILELIGKILNGKKGVEYGAKTTAGLAKLADLATAIDGIAKATAYYAELETMREAYPDKSAKWHEDEAAKVVKLTHQAKSQTPPIIDSLTSSSYGRLFAPFLRFKGEMFRLTGNIIAQSAAEIRSDNPAIRARGYKRAAGFAMISAFSVAGPALISAMYGVGDDEEYALREALPPYLRGNSIIYIPSADGKSITSLDFTYLNPFSFVGDPISRMGRAVMRGEPGDGMDELAIWINSNFLSEQILAGAVGEVLRNEDSDGRPITFETDSADEKLIKFSKHLVGSSFTPQSLKALQRSYDTARRGTPEDTPFFETAAGVLVGHGMPIRPRAFETEALALKAARKQSETNRQVKALAGQLKRRVNYTEGDIQDIVSDLQDSTASLNEDIARMVAGYRGLGLPDAAIAKQLVEAGRSREFSRAIVFRGIAAGPSITPATRRDMYEAGEAAGGPGGGEKRTKAVAEAMRQYEKVQQVRVVPQD